MLYSACVCSVTRSCPTWPHGLQPTRLLCPWDFPGKNTGVGCHFLSRGIFPTQGSNPFLLHWQADSIILSHLESPYSRTLLFIHSVCITSLHLLIPTSHSIPPQTPSPLYNRQVCSLCLSAYFCFVLIDRFICAILDSTYEWYHMMFLFLIYFTWYDNL